MQRMLGSQPLIGRRLTIRPSDWLSLTPDMCVRSGSRLVAVITSPGQSTVYRAWHPSLLSSESQLYPAQTQLSVVFWRHRASQQHPACDWLSVLGEKECSIEAANFGSSGCGVTPHSKLNRFQIWQGTFFKFYIDPTIIEFRGWNVCQWSA